MIACPACGFSNPDGAEACQRCRLSTVLFDPVREAAGVPESDPAYTKAVREILDAIGDEATLPADPAPMAEALWPARFLSTPPPRPASAAAAPHPPEALPVRPALAPGPTIVALRKQIDEYLLLARRQRLDLAEFAERARDAVLAEDEPSLEVLSRDLFVHLAASLTEEYEHLLAKRHELAGLAPTATPDVELEGCRAALAIGDLMGAQRRLRHVDQLLSDLEDQWATVQILIAEAEMLAGTIRDLGGDPSPGLGPLEEGRRLARQGERVAAEPVLSRGILALWALLNPLLARDLGRLKGAVERQRADGADVSPALQHLRALAQDLRRRNFVAAVAAYRRLRETVEPPATAEAPAPGPDREAAPPPSSP